MPSGRCFSTKLFRVIPLTPLRGPFVFTRVACLLRLDHNSRRPSPQITIVIQSVTHHLDTGFGGWFAKSRETVVSMARLPSLSLKSFGK